MKITLAMLQEFGADRPQACDCCGVYLEDPVELVFERGESCADIIDGWCDFYSPEFRNNAIRNPYHGR